MRRFFTYIFLVLIIPIFIILIARRQYAKEKNLPVLQNIFTNKIESSKLWSQSNIEKINKRILKGQSITQEFESDYNNFGTISVLFNNFQKINNDYLIFKLIESSSNKTIYENTYKVDQFNPDFSFTFGFPVINDSKGRKYVFELISKGGTEDDSVGLGDSKYFTSKYDFPISAIKTNPILLIELLKINLESIKQVNTKLLIILFLFYILFLFILISRKRISKVLNRKSIYFKKFFLLIERYFPLILFLITIIISGLFSTIGTDTHHDGIMLKPAIDLSRGLMLFKETFTQYGALSTILQGLSIKIFGEYLIVIRMLTALFYGLIAVELYFIWSKLLPKALAFLSVLIWIFLAPYFMLTFLPWPSVYALSFQCLAIIYMLKFSENNNQLDLLLVGAASALTFWTKQNVGFYTVLGSVFSLMILNAIKKRKKNILDSIINYFIGVLMVSVPLIAWILFNGAIVDWIKQSVIFSSYWVSINDKVNVFESIFPHAMGSISVWAIIPVIVLIFIAQELYKKNNKNLILLIVCLFSVFSLLQYYPITDIRHLYWSATPAIGVVIYFLYQQIFGKLTIKRYLISRIFIFLLACTAIFGLDIANRISIGITRIFLPYQIISEPSVVRNIKLTKEEAEFYSDTYKTINQYINIHGQTNFITIGANALYLTFTKSTNFHPMYVNWKSINESIYKDYPRIKDNYIKDHKPIIIAMWDQIPADYCRINDLVNQADTAFLAVPCENTK